jgi:hypothetical protein
MTVASLERLARNEALFREVNETVAELSAHWDDAATAQHAFVCECAGLDCREQLKLSLDEYRRLRARSDCFAVKPGHEMGPALERVVGAHCDYVIVEKQVTPD